MKKKKNFILPFKENWIIWKIENLTKNTIEPFSNEISAHKLPKNVVKNVLL